MITASAPCLKFHIQGGRLTSSIRVSADGTRLIILEFLVGLSGGVDG